MPDIRRGRRFLPWPGRAPLRQLRARWQRAWRAGQPPIVGAVRAESLTYLDRPALVELFQSVAQAERERRPGILIEAGCALGGSAIVMARAKDRARPFYVYDVFGMPPAPSAGDGPDVEARYAVVAGGRSEGIDGQPYYGYLDDLFERVQASFGRHGIDLRGDNVHLVKARVQETLHVDGPAALAHLDCDRYESVKTCLERIAPRLAPGGVLIVDDYHTWSGCRKAVDEYFAGRGREYRFVRRSRLHVVRS